MSKNKKNKIINKKILKTILLVGILISLIFGGAFFIWATTITLPDLNNFDQRKVAQSTKIYDRTGEIILYDVFGNHKRTIVSLDDMSDYIKKATVAVEDQNFYKHNGIEITAIFRAIRNNFRSGNILGGQGGSTITQQVIKNALLTRDKSITRKLKEWVLAPRLEKVLTKNQILEIYLNEIPYGGSVYGIQEASRRFFGKDAKDLNLIESAYLAGLPQAPTFYSPYGNNLNALENRKNHVLDQMYNSGFITLEQRDEAKNTRLAFERQEEFGIKAPHFVMYIIERLEKDFGRDLLEEGGLRIVTTLDWELQKEAEEIVKRRALENQKRFDAENAALVATDPQTGEILVMVGSRDYFDKEIDGNFNITTANRQPGSTFKPFVYAEAFNKGYRPETVVFDLQTEFSVNCGIEGGNCYSPVNYDGIFRGPMSLRDALAQSINVPAVKTLYLAGLRDSLRLARNMGLESLSTDERRYGLTLVLGGGEVTPLSLAEAYGVFAIEGIRNRVTGILKIEDSRGQNIYEHNQRGERVLSEQTARLISDVLADNIARTPAFGSNSPLRIPGFQVAAKTGTTNDYRDAWTVGYTPTLAVVAWAGNNDNRSMDKQVAGFIITPVWNEFMNKALEKIPTFDFISPEPIDPNIKPVLAGFWKGEQTAVFDALTGDHATENTLPEDRIMAVVGGGKGIHSILHWIDRNNPLGPVPANPQNDPQYRLWEEPVRQWVRNQNISEDVELTDINRIQRVSLEFLSPDNNQNYFSDSVMVISVRMSDRRKITSGEVYINERRFGDLDIISSSVSFIPDNLSSIRFGQRNTAEIIVYDEGGKEYKNKINFYID